MSAHDDGGWSPAEREQLEQELLELHFDCHEDPEALERRLADDPALRALQREVLAKAALLEDAVRPEQPRLVLPDVRRRPPLLRRLAAPTFRMTAAAAAALLTVLGFLAYERFASMRLDRYREQRLHLTVSAPKAVPAGAPWSFTVQTKDLTGDDEAARVRWRAFGDDDVVLAAGEAAADEGAATIAVAAALAVPKRVEVIAASATDEARQVFELSTAAAGPLVHVATDRPVYRPGEPVFVRAVVLDRVTKLPLPRRMQLRAELLDAKGAPVADDRDPETPAGVGSFRLEIPTTSQGGVHAVRVAAADESFAPETLEIVVRAFQNPQLDKQLVLDRKSYAPGARGSAAVTVRRLGDDSAASGALARGALVVDGDEVWHEERGLGADGRATFSFVVPREVAKGAARFVATITDGGVVETEVEPFVVPTGEVVVAAFPEGGELIAGVENGLYLECSDPLGRPIDSSGELRDDRDRRVATFRTLHQGRVRLTFVPERGRSYHVRLAGRSDTQSLPAVRDGGVALRLIGDDVAAGRPLRVAVAGRGDGPWLCAVFCRGVLVGQTTLRGDEAGNIDEVVEVPLADTASGVLRATVFDRRLQPIAERLVRRAPSHRLDVALTPRSSTLTPGETQTVDVRVADETGAGVRAVVGVSVRDSAALAMGDEPRVGLVDHAMLFADVEKVEDLGDFLLDHERNGAHADLLLGTRGWRRYVWRNDAAAQAAIAAKGEAAEGILAREGFSQTPQVLSNLQAANAPLQPLAKRHRDVRRMLEGALGIAILALVVMFVMEGIAALMRRSRPASPLAQVLAGVGGAALLLLTVALLMVPRLGSLAPDAAVMQWAAPDFDGEATMEQLAPPPVEIVEFADRESAFDSNAWNSAVGLGGGAGGRYGGRKPGANGAADVDVLEDEEVASVVRRFEASDEDEARPGYFLRPQDDNGTERADDLAGLVSGRYAIRRLVQRQYAHSFVPTDERRDFTPTILWQTLVVTDERGAASVSFQTSDAVTTWRVSADAHVPTGTGRLGQADATFTCELPLQVEPKLPDEVSAGDRLAIPIAAIVKGAQATEVGLRVRLGDGLRLGAGAPDRIALDARTGRGRVLLPIDVGTTVGDATIEVAARVGRFVDRVRHTVRIAPRGFPHRRAAGGSIAASSPSEWRLVVPSDAVAGSGHATLKVYPSPIAALTEGLEGILREPHGCFEQASSSNYPNTLVLNLLEANGDDVPLVAARARELLPRGYAKITGYECSEKGYEWFGHDPGHEALTAYGLLQFHDMANVYDVDRGMVDRTRQWLLARRDGKGNYPHPTVDHHSFGGRDPKVTNAYVTYALLLAGTPAEELKVEVDALVARVTVDDPYELALIACALEAAGRPEASAARARLAAMQLEDGSLPGARSTITMSGGKDLLVETAGFAVLAWLPSPQHLGNVRMAVEYLQSARDGRGTFGATQATICALRAITAYAQQHRAMREDGTLRVFAGDRQLAEHVFFAADTAAVELDLWNRLEPGEHVLRLVVEGGGDSPLPWSGEVHYHAEQPADDPDTKLTVATSLRKTTVVEGETTALDVVVTNRTDEELPTPIAIVGLPAGLELPTKVLEDLQAAGAFAFWELTGRDLVLYWRKLDPGQKVELTLDLTARVPGTSTGPASRAYLYYTPEQKHWAAPRTVDVTPR